MSTIKNDQSYKKPKSSLSLNLIIDSKNRLLMLLRSKNTQLGCLQWGLPAGKIEKNETPFNAAVRERHEEIGSQHSVQLKKTWGPIRDSFMVGIMNYICFNTIGSEGQFD